MRNPMAVQEMVRRRVRRRRLLRRLRVGVLVVAIVVACGAAAFGIDRMVVSLHRYYAGHGGPAASSTTVVAGAPTPTVTATPGPPACTSPQLSVGVWYWIGTGTSIYEILTMSNISGTPCTLVGYPTLGASAFDGAALPAPATDDPSLGSVPGGPPASSAPVTLGPGTRAWFELGFPDNCSVVLVPGAAAPAGVSDACYRGNYLEVTPPRATSPLLVTEPFHFDYGVAGFDVGPFQGGEPPRTPPVPTATSAPPAL